MQSSGKWIAIVLLCGFLGSPGWLLAQNALPSEEDYYKLITLPVPEGVELEVGGLTMLPNGNIAAATRRGEVWVVENPYMEGRVRPHYRLFARGLHEALGLAFHDNALYTAQRGELTRLKDNTGDGRADSYETVYSWPLDGNYHEYSYGPVIRDDGTMLVTLNLAWVGYGASLSKWRGWMLEITPDGSMSPLASGMRSPAGFGFNEEGDVFYAENQGDWIGSGYITHVEEGDFVGNPAGLRWTDEEGSPLVLMPEDIPDTGKPLFEVSETIPALKPPAVWFPHTMMGISTSSILSDNTGGLFGPFAGQLFVGDQGHSKIARVFLEKVNGVYQGAAFPFREGFASGVLRTIWGKDGSMFVGQTSRGWASTGSESFALQRLVWTGKVPFEVKAIRAMPDGFELEFTWPVDRDSAVNPSSYDISGFTYQYHSTYGSPPINQQDHNIQGVLLSDDGLRARLVVSGLRQGYIHEVKIANLRSEAGLPLLHDVAYYTLNVIPEGEGIDPSVLVSTATETSSEPDARDIADARQSAKRVIAVPESWESGPDVSITVGTVPGLKFDVTQLEVTASSRVKLTFNNNDDMLHNLVVVRPETATSVAEAAMQLGLQGHEMQYVPDSDDVLFHTSLLEPESSEAIYFRAPSEPGEYVIVCTFPGHAYTMQATLNVVAP